MKTAKDPRHKIRRDIVKTLFAEGFTTQSSQTEIVQKILENSTEIDERIKNAATEWPVDKINRIDHAILKLAVFELLESDTPPKVVIDESVELAKEFGSEASPSFVNGVLGTIYKSL